MAWSDAARAASLASRRARGSARVAGLKGDKGARRAQSRAFLNSSLWRKGKTAGGSPGSREWKPLSNFAMSQQSKVIRKQIRGGQRPMQTQRANILATKTKTMSKRSYYARTPRKKVRVR